jgi:hypothetical protein
VCKLPADLGVKLEDLLVRRYLDHIEDGNHAEDGVAKSLMAVSLRSEFWPTLVMLSVLVKGILAINVEGLANDWRPPSR